MCFEANPGSWIELKNDQAEPPIIDIVIKVNPLSSAVLQLSDISCEREGRVLFSGLVSEIQSGEVVQIKGPNGSGKTSLLRILTGLSSDYEGSILYKGVDLKRSNLQFRSDLLYIGHSPGVKRSLTPSENLRWYLGQQSQSHKVERSIGDALAEVGLLGFEDIPCYALSAGQLRRVSLARLFLSSAPIWVLDEPFTAIDVDGVASLEQCFKEHVQKGGVVILTTHQELSLTKVKFLNLLDFVARWDDHD
ncbi:MAG: cytochrome c biogenesis heme-transporting ATPase CcmA [Cellvibrionaceae bacterium]